MRRSPLPIAIAFATAALAGGLTACASGGAATGGSGNFSYGYMVAGSEVASAFGISATDTLGEKSTRTTIPTALETAIKQEVQTGNWNDKCTRLFGGPTVYAAIFHRVCDSGAGPDAEPQVVVGFGADGRKKGTVRWTGIGTVAALVPARRF